MKSVEWMDELFTCQCQMWLFHFWEIIMLIRLRLRFLYLILLIGIVILWHKRFPVKRTLHRKPQKRKNIHRTSLSDDYNTHTHLDLFFFFTFPSQRAAQRQYHIVENKWLFVFFVNIVHLWMFGGDREDNMCKKDFIR